MVLQPADIGFAAQEPEQFIDDRLQVQLLGGDHGKALAQIEAHLVAEQRAGAGAGAVALFGARFQGQAQQVDILAHSEEVPARFPRPSFFNRQPLYCEGHPGLPGRLWR